jgi:hypothetical protein
VDEITDEETLSLLQLAVHTPEVARNVMYPVFFAVGALLLAAVAIFIYHRFLLSVLFVLDFNFLLSNDGDFGTARKYVFSSTMGILILFYTLSLGKLILHVRVTYTRRGVYFFSFKNKK